MFKKEFANARSSNKALPRSIQSTRGFNLRGEPIFFDTPIVPKKRGQGVGSSKTLRQRRSKAGRLPAPKPIFDNAQARLYRNLQLNGGGRRPLKRPAVATAQDEKRGIQGRDGLGGLVDLFEVAIDKKLDRDVAQIEQLVERRVKQERIPRPRTANAPTKDQTPQKQKEGLVRQPTVVATPPDIVEEPQAEPQSGRKLRPRKKPNPVEEQLKRDKAEEKERLKKVREDKRNLEKLQREELQKAQRDIEEGKLNVADVEDNFASSVDNFGGDILNLDSLGGDVNEPDASEREVSRVDDTAETERVKQNRRKSFRQSFSKGLSRVKRNSAEPEGAIFTTPFPVADLVGGGVLSAIEENEPDRIGRRRGAVSNVIYNPLNEDDEGAGVGDVYIAPIDEELE